MKEKLLSIQFRGSLYRVELMAHRQIHNFTPRSSFSSFEFFIILFSRVKHLNRYESKCYDRKYKYKTLRW
jgi:hypothetical protein